MISYYRHAGGYIAVTSQSPAGFEGLAFVGRGGPIDDIQEQLFPASVLTDPVDVVDVPPSWCQALGYHRVDDFPLLDEEGVNLIAEIPVRTPALEPTPIVSDRSPHTRFFFGDHQDIATQIGLILGLIIGVLVLIGR